jgi:GT2 family glycosyltransferase
MPMSDGKNLAAEGTGLVPVSVVIPTCNRATSLLAVLRALQSQTVGQGGLEVIVVDDGSTDGTEAAARDFRRESPLDLIYHKQVNRGPAAARNAGIARARHPLLVFLGDDTIPDPRFLEEHLACHRRHGMADDLAAVGYTTWAARVRPSPFLRFIGEHGPQFNYAAAREETPLGWGFFYTSNLSVSRALLGRVACLFDEDLRSPLWEDSELGFRLLRAGMRLYYHPRAVAYHDHDTDLGRFCRRLVEAGRVSRVLLRKHPELESQLRSTAQARRWARLLGGLDGLVAAASFLDKPLRIPLPRAFYWALVHASYVKGAADDPGDNTRVTVQRNEEGVRKGKKEKGGKGGKDREMIRQ